VLAADLFPGSTAINLLADGVDTDDYVSNNVVTTDLSALEPGQIGGTVVDPNGAVVAGAEVIVINTQTGARQTTRVNSEGRWLVAGMQPGLVSVVIRSPGFKEAHNDLNLLATQPARIGTTLEVGQAMESVTVTANSISNLMTDSSVTEDAARKRQAAPMNNASQNVFNLQRRVAGILPVAVEVPRSGRSYLFVRPLVLEEETKITFQYKAK
jgi:hypothetical protein